MNVKARMSVELPFKRLLEENASNATNAVQEEERTAKRLEEENRRMAEDMRNMQKRIESEQGDLSLFQERQAKAAAQRADLENQGGNSIDILNFGRKTGRKTGPLVHDAA